MRAEDAEHEKAEAHEGKHLERRLPLVPERERKQRARNDGERHEWDAHADRLEGDHLLEAPPQSAGSLCTRLSATSDTR